MTIPVVKPYRPNKDKYQRYVSDIFDRAWFTNNGPLVTELERRLESHLGVKNVICVANCTIGLQVLYRALGLKGDVLTTPFSFIATRSSLEWEGLCPQFCDVCPDSWNLSTQSVTATDRVRPSAILGVHVYGNPCDVKSFEKISSDYGVPVIYDAAHAFDVKVGDESVLNYGAGSVLSFHATKLFHTIEGGAVVVNSDLLAERVRELTRFGQIMVGGQKVIGINAKLSEVHAAMGLAILDEIEIVIEKRRRIYDFYSENLKGNFQLQFISTEIKYNYAYFPLLFNSISALEACIESLEKNGIYPRRYFSSIAGTA